MLPSGFSGPAEMIRRPGDSHFENEEKSRLKKAIAWRRGQIRIRNVAAHR